MESRITAATLHLGPSGSGQTTVNNRKLPLSSPKLPLAKMGLYGSFAAPHPRTHTA